MSGLACTHIIRHLVLCVCLCMYASNHKCVSFIVLCVRMCSFMCLLTAVGFLLLCVFIYACHCVSGDGL